MKQKFLKTMLLLCALVVGSSYAWATDVTYTFSSKAWAATSGGSDANWTSGKDGNSYYNGVQVTTGVSGANATSPTSFSNVTNVRVYYHTNKNDGVGSIKVKIGTGMEKSFSVTKPGKDAGLTSKYTDFSFSNETGNIKLTVDCSTNSVYIESVVVTYTAGFVVTYNANGATSGSVPTDATAYSSGATVTVKGNTGSLAKIANEFGGWNTQADGLGTNYTAGTGTFSITANTTLYAKWNAKTISTLTYSGTLTKTNYYAGQSFDPTGLTVTATYTDASEEDVTSSVTWTPDPLTKGTTAVTGAFMGKEIEVTGLTVTAVPGTEERPYTVAEAKDATPATGTSDPAYIHGIVSAFYSSTITGDATYHRYYFSDDGTTSGQLLVFNGKKRSGTAFSDADDIRVGDVVTIYGGLTTYNSTKEVAADNYIVSHQIVAPTFSVAEGLVSSGTTVTLSDLHTGATIYYTTDGSTPTSSSTAYTSAITLTETTTIKAIAIKSGYTDSEVVSATYTVASQVVTPQFSPVAGTYTSIQNVGISTTTPGATIYYTTDGSTPTTSSSVYSTTIPVSVNMTIKAIAVKDGMIDSEIAEAAYVINIPRITLDPTSKNATYAEADGNIAVTYENIADHSSATIFFCDSEGAAASYSWCDADFTDGEKDEVYYAIGENMTGSARSAYFKVKVGEVYSGLFTISQAAYVAPSESFVKVKSTAGITDGDYLIVYETGNVAFDGGGATLDKSSNTISVTIVDEEIEASDATKAATFNIDVTNGKLKSKSNYYIGVSSNNNGLGTSDKAATYTNAFSIDGSYNAVIAPVFDGSTYALQYNKTSGQERFRYYGSDKQEAIQLYKLTNLFSVKLNSKGYATFCSKYPLDFTSYATDEFSAWQITDANSTTGVITFSQITGTIKSGTGILLKGTANATITLASTSSTNVLSDNLLEGTTVPTDVADNEYYGLSGNTFVKVKASTVPAGKALLPADLISTGSGVKAFTFVFEDEADGIQTLSESPLQGENIYNLAGQRLQKMQKGINIVNGKKVLY